MACKETQGNLIDLSLRWWRWWRWWWVMRGWEVWVKVDEAKTPFRTITKTKCSTGQYTWSPNHPMCLETWMNKRRIWWLMMRCCPAEESLGGTRKRHRQSVTDDAGGGWLELEFVYIPDVWHHSMREYIPIASRQINIYQFCNCNYNSNSRLPLFIYCDHPNRDTQL